eukprot:TRINITY_DN7938_c0_g1_i1.p1 TRINITY_DN7938_c0_g1~~TRINITY_DN7938_c0_g1_i1.p1  ORF type:complete len:146 (-),score=1.84 TRINITY_DN7938_c0_g1_i1:328-765(-)
MAPVLSCPGPVLAHFKVWHSYLLTRPTQRDEVAERGVQSAHATALVGWEEGGAILHHWPGEKHAYSRFVIPLPVVLSGLIEVIVPSYLICDQGQTSTCERVWHSNHSCIQQEGCSLDLALCGGEPSNSTTLALARSNTGSSCWLV